MGAATPALVKALPATATRPFWNSARTSATSSSRTTPPPPSAVEPCTQPGRVGRTPQGGGSGPHRAVRGSAARISWPPHRRIHRRRHRAPGTDAPSRHADHLCPGRGRAPVAAGIDLRKLDMEASREHLRTRKPTVFVEVLPGTPGFGSCLRTCAATTASTATWRADSLLRLEAPDILTAPLLDRYGCQHMILSAAPHVDRWPPTQEGTKLDVQWPGQDRGVRPKASTSNSALVNGGS